MAALAVVGDQLLGGGQPDAVDHRVHVALAQAVEFFQRPPLEHAEHEFLVREDVQPAVLIVLEETVIGGFEAISINDTLVDQEFPPEMVGISGDQSVVQVENSQCHGPSPVRVASLAEAMGAP